MQATLQPLSFDYGDVRYTAERLCKALARALGEADEAVVDYDYEGRVEEIESEPRSGFSPWTSGGYHVTLAAALAHHWGTGSAPAPLQPMLDAGDRFIAEAWAERFPERPPLLDCIHADDGSHAAAFRAEAEEWEVEGWAADTDFYFWKARVMFLSPEDTSYRNDEAPEPGEPYVYVDAYLNTDLNYGRDSIRWLSAYGSDPNQTVGDFKRVFTLAQFAALDEDAIKALTEEAIKELP